MYQPQCDDPLAARTARKGGLDRCHVYSGRGAIVTTASPDLDDVLGTAVTIHEFLTGFSENIRVSVDTRHPPEGLEVEDLYFLVLDTQDRQLLHAAEDAADGLNG